MNLFQGIAYKDVSLMIDCFECSSKRYISGETITSLTDHISYVYMVRSGKARLQYIDYEGNLHVLEHFEKDSVFGELFSMPIGNLEFYVEAETDCEILLIPYEHLTCPCENACVKHVNLIRNLFMLTAKKSQELSLRISFLSRKTLQDKLLTYFEYLKDASGNTRFRLPMSLSALADYLCVNRTSLMREMRILNEQNIIQSKGRNIILNKELQA